MKLLGFFCCFFFCCFLQEVNQNGLFTSLILPSITLIAVEAIFLLLYSYSEGGAQAAFFHYMVSVKIEYNLNHYISEDAQFYTDSTYISISSLLDCISLIWKYSRLFSVYASLEGGGLQAQSLLKHHLKTTE